jgi:hypothetical protein
VAVKITLRRADGIGVELCMSPTLIDIEALGSSDRLAAKMLAKVTGAPAFVRPAFTELVKSCSVDVSNVTISAIFSPILKVEPSYTVFIMPL